MKGNLLGVFMLIASAVVGVGGMFVLKLKEFQTMIAVGLTLLVMDLLFRLARRGAPKWLYRSESGGFFFFAPIWIVGLVIITVNVLIGFGVIKR